MRLFTHPASANGYKVELLLHQLVRSYERVVVDIFAGEGAGPEFRTRSPAGNGPVLELADGRAVFESNAILVHLARGPPLLPTADETAVLSWLFYEQNAIEPVIGSARFWRLTGRDRSRPEETARRIERGTFALGVLEDVLATRSYLAGEHYTIADLAVYAYTHLAGDIGIELAAYPAVDAWCERIVAQPRYVAGPERYPLTAMV